MQSSDTEKPKPDPRLIALMKQTANLPSRKELAKREIRNGIDPRYVAMKYGLDVGQVLAAVEVWKARQGKDA